MTQQKKVLEEGDRSEVTVNILYFVIRRGGLLFISPYEILVMYYS